MSTSSSEKPKRPFRPYGLLFAVGLLLAFELGVARQEWFWTWEPRSHSGMVDAMEQALIQPAPPPTIVLVGSSTLRDGIAPRLLEQELGLSKGSTLNIAMSLGSPFDALTFYRRNHDKLSKARLLVVGVEDSLLSSSVPPNSRDMRFATLSERLESGFNRHGKLALLAGWAWRTYAGGSRLPGVLLGKLTGQEPAPLPLQEDGRVVYRPETGDTGPATVDVKGPAFLWYEHDYEPGGRFGELQRLVDTARADGLEVLLVHLPARDAFVDHVQSRWPERYAELRKRTEAITGARLRFYERASELGIAENHFYDVVHVTPLGCREMTAELARAIRTEYPALWEGTRAAPVSNAAAP